MQIRRIAISPRPQFHRLQSPCIADLAKAGISPEDVDYVMCTHLQCDHAVG